MLSRTSTAKKVIDRAHYLLLALACLQLWGCAQHLDMTRHGGTAPHTVIPYNGVRTGAARFEDYSGVDRTIFDAPAKK